MKKLFIALFFASAPNFAHAAMVTFDFEDVSAAGNQPTYTSNGYNFASERDLILTSNNNNFLTNTGTLNRPDNQLFDVISIDMASTIPSNNSFFVAFTGTFSDNSTIKTTFSFTGNRVFSTKTFNGFTNLKSLFWSRGVDSSGIGSSSSYVLDNIVLNSNAVVTAVPEPETYAMFLAGLGLLGFASRRKKSA